MVYDYHVVLGVAATAVNLFGFVPYLLDIFRGTTKPHPFTWFMWALVGSVGFFAQLAGGGGAGAWATGAGAFMCFFVGILSLSRGEKHIVMLDWLCLAGALTGLVLWRLTDEPLLAVVFATVADALGFVPTFRKSYAKPYEETASAYALAALAFSLSIVALDTLSLTTILFPAYIILSAGSLFILLMVRRRQLGPQG